MSTNAPERLEPDGSHVKAGTASSRLSYYCAVALDGLYLAVVLALYALATAVALLVADNGIVEDACVETDSALASVDYLPYLAMDWESECWRPDIDSGIEGAVGVVRVHVDPGGDGIGLSVDLESAEVDFEAGVLVSLDAEQARRLTSVIEQTLDGLEAQR